MKTFNQFLLNLDEGKMLDRLKKIKDELPTNKNLVRDLGIQWDTYGPNNPTDRDLDVLGGRVALKAMDGWHRNPDGSVAYPKDHPLGHRRKRNVNKLMNKFFKLVTDRKQSNDFMVHKIIKTDATPQEKALFKQMAAKLNNGLPAEKELLDKISTILKSKQIKEGGMGGKRAAGYKMKQSKDPYTVKYSAKKDGPVNITVVDGKKAAEKFLKDIKKKGMNGIIKKGWEQPGSTHTIKYNQSYDELQKAMRYDTLTGKK